MVTCNSPQVSLVPPQVPSLMVMPPGEASPEVAQEDTQEGACAEASASKQ